LLHFGTVFEQLGFDLSQAANLGEYCVVGFCVEQFVEDVDGDVQEFGLDRHHHSE
jgi:hypothetical protein